MPRCTVKWNIQHWSDRVTGPIPATLPYIRMSRMESSLELLHVCVGVLNELPYYNRARVCIGPVLSYCSMNMLCSSGVNFQGFIYEPSSSVLNAIRVFYYCSKIRKFNRPFFISNCQYITSQFRELDSKKP